MRLALALWLGVSASVPRVAHGELEHTVFGELFGKGGLWGAGYELGWSEHFGAGAVASYYLLGGDRYATLSPYASARTCLIGRHRYFAQLGPQIVHRTVPSPVPEWSGYANTGYDVELTLGFEHDGEHQLVYRAVAMVEVGEHVVPWLGLSLGRQL